MSDTFFTSEISDARFETDGLRHITVKSRALGGRADITVFVPTDMKVPTDLPVVILLHGVYGSHWAWTMKAGVHRTAQRMMETGELKPMVLAMPSDGLYGDGSGYIKHRQANYEAWIVQEVPQALRELIQGVTTASDYFIAGLSMGGYGALRLGAKYPQVFKSFAGLSSITEFSQLADFCEPGTFETLGVRALHPESVLEVLLNNKEKLGLFRFDCGTDDSLFEANQQLHDALNYHGIRHTFEALPGGHTWDYWERNINRTLQFFSDTVAG
ncbi:alpha/beta hydrolase [Salmonirosea aquatica]|uniref:Esterase family protein n=1 Tax=Salmonirosea aquatica TaxID=2654236 RepID=A0A7C9FNK4_9BACT|nr:esterase family protein [Cytophagaceae bacterium SJW1-29]